MNYFLQSYILQTFYSTMNL